MAFNVSLPVAYVVLYGILLLFTFLAVASTGWFPLSKFLWFMLNGNTKNDGTTVVKDSTDHFLSARNSAGSFAIGMSYFASGMGAWVLYGTTEMGANPALSWIAVLGYSVGSAMPAILIGILIGPQVRAMTNGKVAFSTTDFGRKRYGRIMQVTIACVSGFYMFIFIVAELTAISGIFQTVTNNFSKSVGLTVTITVGLVTVFYTALAGLPASITTDKFQGLIMAVLVVLLTFTVTLRPDNRVSMAEFRVASNWTVEGGMAAVTLILAICSAELFNQGTWQRVWAAKDERAMLRGFALGSIMVFFLMMFFGIMGILAYANDPTAYDNGDKLNFLAFFDLLAPLHPSWHILTLILVTALAASSVDSLQNGMASIFSRDLVKIGWNPKAIARGLVFLLNLPAMYLAGKGKSVLELFLVADLVCATAAFPVFCGLQTKDYGILIAPTELGAFLGVLAGIATVLINGVINGVDGNVFQYFWLQNGGICALCGSKTLISFIVTPLVSLVVTYVASFLHVLVRGDKARAPIFATAFDDDGDDEVETGNMEDKMVHVEYVDDGGKEWSESKAVSTSSALDMGESTA